MIREVGQLSVAQIDLNTSTLLQYASDSYGCCGITSEPNCSFTHQPVDKCFEGSPNCRSGCLDAVVNRNIAPFVETMAGAAFVMGSFAVIELLLEIRKIGKTFVQG